MVLRFALEHKKKAWQFAGTREERQSFLDYLGSDESTDQLNELAGVPRAGAPLWYSIWHEERWSTTSKVEEIFDLTDREIGGIVINHAAIGRRLLISLPHALFVAVATSRKARAHN
jgi:hypothetical protein